MSSTLREAEVANEEAWRQKKRKYEGDSKEPKKKKRKQIEAEGNGVPEADAKATKKDKKTKLKRAEGCGEDDDSADPSITINGTAESASSMKKGKKNRKHKGNELEDDTSARAQDEERYQGPEAEDIELPDAPSVAEDEMDATKPAADEQILDIPDAGQLQSTDETSFHSIRTSLYLSIPAIASSSSQALSAILSLHLSPLLLTYFPPVEGVILSYHDPVISAKPRAISRRLAPPQDTDSSSSAEEEEKEEINAIFGEEFGSSWVWLTVTFLVFKPQPGDELNGYPNAMSEGFIGLVSYNYFQASIAKNRIPKSWTWSGPSRKNQRQRKIPRKGKLNDSDGPSQESALDSQETEVTSEDDAREDEVGEDDATDETAGTFVDEDGAKIPDNLKFRVVDLEMIPAQERKLALQMEGTLLDQYEEVAVREEERQKFEARLNKSKARSKASGTPMTSGGLPTHSRAGSVTSILR